MSVLKLKTKQIMLSTVAAAAILMSGCSDGNARLGRLADANVKIFEISDNGKQVLKWEETTSSGNYLDEIGYFPTHDYEVDENKFYLIEIANGENWDSNNDGTIDVSSQHNNGKVRAIAKGNEIKDLGNKLNVTVVSEIVYQLVKDDLNNFDIKTFQTKLNHAATKVLSYDIDGISSKSNNQINGYCGYSDKIDEDKSKIEPKIQLDSISDDLDNKDILAYDPSENKNALTGQYFNKMDNFRNNIFQGKEITLDNRFIKFQPKKKVEKTPIVLNPKLIASISTNKIAYKITLSKDGRTAYASVGLQGLVIIDIVNPKNPIVLGSFDTDGETWGITLSNDGRTAYLADNFTGIKIIDISNSKNPTLISSLQTYGASEIKLSKDGKKMYIADFGEGIKIVDISNPRNPTLIGSLDTNGWSMGITLSNDGTKAYLADYRKGIKIVDISNPRNPTLLGSLDTNGLAERITLSNDGTKAYLADGQKGLKIINVSNPRNPTLISSLDTNGDVRQVVLSNDGKKAYLADGTEGLKIINITNPENPTLVSSLDTNGIAWGVTLSQHSTNIYISDGKKGIKIIDLYYKKPGIGAPVIGLKLIGNPNPNRRPPVF